MLRAAELRLDLLLAEYLAKSFADRPVPSEEERVRSRHMIKEWDYRNKRQSGEAKPQDQPEDDWGEPNIEEDILDWLFSITQNLSPEQLHDSESLRTFNAIVKTSLTCKGNELINTYAVLFNAYLQDPIIQQKVIGPDFLGPIIDFTLRYATELPSSGDHEETTKAIMRALSTQQIDSEFTYGDDYEQVIRLVNSLSAISASDEFISQYNINSPELDNVKRELHSKARGPATVIACIMLGNLATSNEASESMTRAMNLHLPLLDILSSNEEPALLYAAAGFIRHLAFAEANREALAKAGLINVCCRLLGQSDPSVRGEAAAILGKLASNNLPNIKQIVFESPSVDGLPSHSSDTRTNTNETILQYLVTQALAPSAPLPSTSMKNVVIEIGRTIVTIMRSVSQQSNSQELALQVFKTPLVARPVARLVRQRFFADARAEGLLGLGLMAQFREGAECVIEEIQADKGLLEAVKELAGLQDSGKGQKTENWGRDHQNTLVLLHALGKNGVST